MAQLHQSASPKRKPYEGQFANMEFPPYKYQEYPKVIGKTAAGQDIIVEDQREELEWIAKGEIHKASEQSKEAEHALAVALAAESQAEVEKLKSELAELKALLSAKPGLLDELPKAKAK